MSMTKDERRAKDEILYVLDHTGYPTYANLLEDFDINITDDPGVVGYMLPSKGVIVLNRGLDMEQVSTIVRHEILHEYLKHEQRLLDHLEKSLKPKKDLEEYSIEELKEILYSNDDFNVAADYEISNRGYTDADKEVIRGIKLNGQILTGLVTEDDHPDWVDLSVEDMYDKLQKLRKKPPKKKPEDTVIYGDFIDDTTFVDDDKEVWGSGSLIDYILKSTKELLKRPEVTDKMKDEIKKGLLGKGFSEEDINNLFN